VVGYTANNLTTGENVPELTCLHTEADADLFSIYGVFRSDGYTAAHLCLTQRTWQTVTMCKQHNYVAKITPGKLC